MSDDSTQGPTATVRIVGGGTPSAEVLAALAVALTPVTVDGADAGGGAAMPAWAQAALLENVGGRRIAAPADLQRPGQRP